jgi:hypothetical protein
MTSPARLENLFAPLRNRWGLSPLPLRCHIAKLSPREMESPPAHCRRESTHRDRRRAGHQHQDRRRVTQNAAFAQGFFRCSTKICFNAVPHGLSAVPQSLCAPPLRLAAVPHRRSAGSKTVIFEQNSLVAGSLSALAGSRSLCAVPHRPAAVPHNA